MSSQQTLGQMNMSFFGIPSFGKAPIASDPGQVKADVAVFGVPFDQATGYRSGTRFGPKAIRDMSVRLSFFNPGAHRRGYWDLRSGRRRLEDVSLVDCGDVEVTPLGYEGTFERITNMTASLLAAKALPVVLGGDHAITFPVVRAFEGTGSLTIVHLDAHLDYRDAVLGVRYGHGSVIRRVRELSFVEQIISIGIRGLRTREEDYRASEADGNRIIPAWQVHQEGVAAAVDALPLGKRYYVTLDIDVLDPGLAPGTGTPEVGGLTYEQVRSIVEAVGHKGTLVGFDLVEVNPHFDPAGVTALLAAQLTVEMLAVAEPALRK